MTDYTALIRMGNDANRERGQRNAESYRWILAELFEQGLSYRAIARTLDERRFRTPEDGRAWNPGMVHRIVSRLGLQRSSQTRLLQRAEAA